MPKTTRVRVNLGLRGLDAVQVNKKTRITKAWTEVSLTLAKSLIGLEYKGRPKFEFEDGEPDNGEPESSTEETSPTE